MTCDRSQITRLLIRDAPVAGAAYLLMGILMWIVYVSIRRKLRLVTREPALQNRSRNAAGPGWDRSVDSTSLMRSVPVFS
jgi:hypothetical protein